MGIMRNWRNPKDYEFTKNLTRDGWTWEFLRRNPKYIKDWEKALEKNEIDREKYKDELLPKIIKLLETGEGTVDLIPGFGKKINVDNMSAMDRKILIIYARDLLIEKIPSNISRDRASADWGFCLDEMINPEIDNPQEDFYVPIFKTFGHYYSREHLNLFPDPEKYEVAILVDLSKKLKPQMDYITKILKEEQNDLKNSGKINVKSGKNPLENWTIYLRILDAKKENVQDKEIAKIIFPQCPNTVDYDYEGSRRVKDSYKAAMKMVKGGYREILPTAQPILDLIKLDRVM